MEELTIAFHGAARTVTGSRHLMRLGSRRWLFDCGLYQGRRDEADRINRTYAFDPRTLEAVVLSHAHLDHSGNLPTAVALGFAGPVHATSATAQLSTIMLLDSALLMQRDVEFVNRRRGEARRPLHSLGDAEEVSRRFATHDYRTPWALADDVEVEFFDAGHILGSALTTFEFRHDGRTFRLGMSGDLGRPRRPILQDPEVHPGVDALVLESTYGDRLHPDAAETERRLIEIVTRTVERGGRLMVPSFAVGRVQEVVATLHALTERGALPPLPIFVDSPLSRQAVEIFKRHPECFDPPTQRSFRDQEGAPFGFHRLRYIATAAESKALNDMREPLIVIAGSGMCEGGRILHHLRHGLGNPANTVLFVGFQAERTLGRRLRDGAETVNVFGEPVQVRAEVAALDGFSAHADQGEILAWVARLDPRPRRIFLVHGELGPAETLAALLRERLGAEVAIPEKGQEFALWN
jgi:metallo-beta-lactamase family protein